MRTLFKRWAPALIVMLAIFLISSRPSDRLPDFHSADHIVKATGHVIGYGLLACSYLYALGPVKQRYGLAWIFAILYGISDEIHQSFVPGRSSSVSDVLLFDNLGAVAALSIYYYVLTKTNIRRNQPLRAAETE